MRKLFILLFVLGLGGFASAQWVIQSFDDAPGAFFLDPPVVNTNYFTDGDSTAYCNLSSDADHYEGTGSRKVDYNVQARDTWGGYLVRNTYVPGQVDSLPFIDLSAGTELDFWYKVITPADTSQGGAVFSEIKLAEFGDGARDLWVHHTDINYFDESGDWIHVVMPLIQSSDNTVGFARDGGNSSGDGVFELAKVKGFEFSVVFTTGGGSAPYPTAKGSILIDNLQLVGNNYVPFTTFDDTTGLFDAFDWMDWAGDAGKGSIDLSINTTDKVEGTGSMQLDYTVNTSQDYGGYINMTHHFSAVPDTFQERTALVLYIKNMTPHTGTANRLTMRFFLSENNTGVNEDWVCEVPVDLSQASDWTRYYMPLEGR